MKHEQLQADFYRDFEGYNWHADQDYLADQADIVRTEREIDRAEFGESIRAKVRAARIAKENQRLAKQIGVSHDDTH